MVRRAPARSRHDRRIQKRLVLSMSEIFYFRAPTPGPTQAPTKKAEAQETSIYCAQADRIAHDLKNCMAVFLLAVSSLQDLKDNQAFISASRKRVLENVVEEMNRLVDEMVRLTGRRLDK